MAKTGSSSSSLRRYAASHPTINGLNPRDLYNFKNAVGRSLARCKDPVARQNAAVAAANYQKQIAVRRIETKGVSVGEEFYGNIVSGFNVERSGTTSGARLVMESPHKTESTVPDAYYIEYGYGLAGRDCEAPPPPGYEPGSEPHGKDDWWKFNNVYTGETQWNMFEGFVGAAPMYVSTMNLKEQLSDDSRTPFLKDLIYAEFDI